jgi:hypothetical protein
MMTHRLTLIAAALLTMTATLGLRAPTAHAWDEEEALAPLVTLASLNVAQGVANRQPVALDGPFYADGSPVYVYLVVNNPSGQAQTLTLTWYHEGDFAFTQTVEAGQSPHWRTWAWAAMRASRAGEWVVEVSDANGTFLDETRFSVFGDEDSDALTELGLDSGC